MSGNNSVGGKRSGSDKPLFHKLGTALLIPFLRTGYVLNRIEGVLLLLVYGDICTIFGPEPKEQVIRKKEIV